MQVGDLKEALTLLNMASDPKSPLTAFRAIHVSKEMLAAASARCGLVARLSLGIDTSFMIHPAHLLRVVATLPPDRHITFTKDGTALDWHCGTAHGFLATAAAQEEAPTLPRLPNDEMIECSAELADIFKVGAAATRNPALLSLDLHGVQIVQHGKDVICLSSDNATIAVARCEAQALADEPLTIRPLHASLLHALISRKGKVAFTERGILYTDALVTAVIARIMPLKYDLWSYAQRYVNSLAPAFPLQRDQIAAFVKRATGLAETRQRTTVRLTASQDRLTIRFAEQLAMTEEFIILNGMSFETPLTVTINDALKLSAMLTFCDFLSLAFLDGDEPSLVFRSQDARFFYVVACVRPPVSNAEVSRAIE
jgi:hypothetical protein